MDIKTSAIRDSHLLFMDIISPHKAIRDSHLLFMDIISPHKKKGRSTLVLSPITPLNTPGELRSLVHLSGEIKDTPKPDIHGKLKRKPKYLSAKPVPPVEPVPINIGNPRNPPTKSFLFLHALHELHG